MFIFLPVVLVWVLLPVSGGDGIVADAAVRQRRNEESLGTYLGFGMRRPAQKDHTGHGGSSSLGPE